MSPFGGSDESGVCGGNELPASYVGAPRGGAPGAFSANDLQQKHNPFNSHHGEQQLISPSPTLSHNSVADAGSDVAHSTAPDIGRCQSRVEFIESVRSAYVERCACHRCTKIGTVLCRT